MATPAFVSPVSGTRVRATDYGVRAEAALSEIALVEGFLRLGNDPILLEPFQVGFMGCRARFRCVEKSRQVGMSWAIAAESVARAHLRAAHEATFISYNLGDAKEKIRYAKQLAESLPGSFRKKISEDSKTALSFDSPSGAASSRIVSWPSKAPRGKGGDVYLDELAHYQDDTEVYTGSTALIARRPDAQLTVCSTPAGRRGMFWMIARRETEADYSQFVRFRVPWWLSRAYCRDPEAASADQMIWHYSTEQRIQKYGRETILEQYRSLLPEDFAQEFECVPSGACVVTGRGPVPIESVRVGDVVLTHTGERQPVTDVSTRPYDGMLVSLTTYHARLPLEVTPNHPVLMLRDPCRGKSRRVSASLMADLPEPRFVPAGEVRKHDILVYPVPRADADKSPTSVRVADHFVRPVGYRSKNRLASAFPVDDAFLRLAGYYLSEGSIGSSGRRTCFSFHTRERHLVDRVRQDVESVFGLKCSERTQGQCTTIGVNSVVVAAIMRSLFGSGAENKSLPDAWTHLPVNRLRVLVDAYLDGDGHRRPGLIACSTVSPTLAFQIRDFFVRAGDVATLRQDLQRPALRIRGRIVKVRRLLHEVRVHPRATTSAKGRRGWNDGRYLYLPVRVASSRPYRGNVHNLTVARDHSYVVGSHAVHNCAYVDEAHSYFPWELLLRCARDFALHEDFSGWDVRGRLTAGYDVGRIKDLAALVIVEEWNNQMWPRLILTWHRRPFEEQYAVCVDALSSLPIAKFYVDRGGIGMNLAEDLVRRFGSRVIPTDFTVQSKETLATDVRVRLEQGAMTLPKHRDLLTQMHAIRRSLGPGGRPRFDSERNARHHGDVFWALALAAQRERDQASDRTHVVRARVI
jgi:phage FluMu gp28-like protein